MRRLWSGMIVLLMLFAAIPVQATYPFADLQPGAKADLTEQVPVNFVFVGYEPEDVDTESFIAALPAEYKPVIRSRQWYTDEPDYLGIRYTYDYRTTFADAAYEEQFFSALSDMATPTAVTVVQQWYNEQQNSVLDIAENHFIDAPSVEQWLALNPPDGVDTTRNTVFFVNWWGNGTTPREGFKHHLYTKTNEPDPDTNYNFGEVRVSRKIIAWGGTAPNDEENGYEGEARRIWFYDLSAGPEYWTDNWNVDDADLDGDGEADYRMPPVWEYFHENGYRPAAELTGDLAKIARYVAINLLFTSSPLYPPELTPNRMPATINLQLNTYEGSSKVPTGSDYQTTDLLVAELSEVHRVEYSVTTQDIPFTGEAQHCYTQMLRGTQCHPERPQYPASANVYLDAALNLDRFGSSDKDYDARFFNYVTNDNKEAGPLGYADDNWYDGTQSATFNFLSPGIIAAGYGLTTTQIHEYGHHFGMSHPHDGYDAETNVDYGPSGEFYYVGAGDEVNSMMSYIDLNWDYSQFDRDNANRFQAAAYITNAQAIAAKVLDSPNAAEGMSHLSSADDHIRQAKSAMSAHDYVATFDHARAAFEDAMGAAEAAGVTVEASSNGWVVGPVMRGHGYLKKQERSYSHVDKLGPGTHRSKR